MSYLSTVAVKCEEKAFKILKEIYAEYGLMPDRIYEEDRFKIIFFDWMEWNKQFEAIKVFEEAISDLYARYGEEGYRYSYLRVGEFIEDSEHSDNGLDECDCLEYKIEINLDHAKDITEEITDDSLLS